MVVTVHPTIAAELTFIIVGENCVLPNRYRAKELFSCQTEIARLADICGEIIESITNKKVGRHSSSTDCNIPLSLGIPAICVGVYRGGGAHTREEWIEKASLKVGLEAGIRMIGRIVKI